MGSKRRRNQQRSKSCPFHFQTLIDSPQGLSPDALESLYLLLLNLDCSNSDPNSNFSETEFKLNELTVKFRDIHELSNLLFDQLNAKFEELLSALDDFSAHPVRVRSTIHVNVKAAVKELSLLLRCCLVAFKLLVLDQELVVEKGRILLGILRRCARVELKGGNDESCTSVESEALYVNEDGAAFLAEQLVTSISSSEHSNPFNAIFCAMLEVFADELLMHESVRQYLLLIDSCSKSDVNEFLFLRHFGPGNIGSVLEVISAHFILSISDDEGFKKFLSRLFWIPDNDFRVPEMSLTTALSLLLNPIMLSAPKMFQAYLILLVSEVIGISMSSEPISPSGELRSYLSAFQRAVSLYARHMSNLHMKGYPIVDDDSFVKSHFLASNSKMNFESCLLPATKVKINNLIAKCENLWNSYLNNTLLKQGSDLVSASVAYTKESLHVFEESSRDKILSILSCIILRGSSDDIDETLLHKKEDISLQDICLLASILKLMSGSMFQATRILRQGRNSGSLKTLENVALSKGYDFMLSIFDGFQQFSTCLPVQKFLHDIMEVQPTKHKKSKWMLFHFSGLMSLSYASGLDFLVKNCIFTLMVLLNLFVFEEGDLHALGSLLCSGVETSSCKSPIKVGNSKSCHKAREVLVDRKSSKAIALKFQKIRTLYLGKHSQTTSTKGVPELEPGSLKNGPIMNHVESALSIEENAGGTCNGEIFLSCILKGSTTTSDIDDLKDFIECKEGKDYSQWLKGHERYKRWKSEKVAKLSWKKKRSFRREHRDYPHFKNILGSD